MDMKPKDDKHHRSPWPAEVELDGLSSKIHGITFFKEIHESCRKQNFKKWSMLCKSDKREKYPSNELFCSEGHKEREDE